MNIARNVLLWVIGIAAFFYLMAWAEKMDTEDCEVRLAKELNTTAVYINNNCMVKGYGRANGR